MLEWYQRNRLTQEQFVSSQFVRLKHIRQLQERGDLNGMLAWREEQHRAA